jgi:hypothetical protein
MQTSLETAPKKTLGTGLQVTPPIGGAVTKAPGQALQTSVETKPPAPAQKPKTKATAETQVVEPEQPDMFQELQDYTNQMLTATEDPNATRLFNQAMTRIGLFNQAQRDSLQMQINADPALANQGAGYALLGLLAQQQGFNVADMLTNLSVESAKIVADMNKWGANMAYKIWDAENVQKNIIRGEILAAGDFGGYANQFEADTGIAIDVQDMKEQSPETQQAVATQLDLMWEAIKNEGPESETALGHFNTIMALAPNLFKGATFEAMVGSEGFMVHSEMEAEIEGDVRTSIAQGNWGDAADGIRRLHPDETIRIDNGQTMIDTMSLGDLNDMLEAAGMDTVTDKTELYGIEDDVFVASEIARLKDEYETNTIDVETQDLLGELHEQGWDITDPELVAAVRAYVFDINYLPTDENGNLIGVPIPPWEDGSLDAHLFSDWPKYNFETGVLEYTGGTAYGPSNPKEDPTTSLGQYNDNLDRLWESYLLTTPQDEVVSRETWYYGTMGGTVPYDEANVQQYAASKLPTDTDTSGGLAEFESWLSQGKDLTDTQISWLTSINKESIPIGFQEVKDWKATNTTSGWINMDGKGFRVDSGGSGEMTGAEGGETITSGWVLLMDLDGNKYWLSGSGVWYKNVNGVLERADDPTK